MILTDPPSLDQCHKSKMILLMGSKGGEQGQRLPRCRVVVFTLYMSSDPWKTSQIVADDRGLLPTGTVAAPTVPALLHAVS